MWGKQSRAQTWSAKQTVNGASGDTSAALETTQNPTNRKLLWEFALPGGSTKGRIYSGQIAGSGTGFEFTLNAVWNGSAWTADDSAGGAYRLAVVDLGLFLSSKIPASGTWTDGTWPTAKILSSSAGSLLSFPGSTLMGADIVGSSANAQVARLSMSKAPSATAVRTLMIEMPSANSSQSVRIYRSTDNTESLEITFNARWNGSAWVPDVVGNFSAKYVFYRNALLIYNRDAGGSSWDDTTNSTGWDQGNTILLNVQNGFLVAEQYFSSRTDIATGTGVTNKLYANNIVKAWASVVITGNFPNLGNVTSSFSGFGVEASGTDIGDTSIQVNWAQAFADTSYAVVVTPSSGTAYTPRVTNKTTTSCRIAFAYGDDGTTVNFLSSGQVLCHLIAIGPQ